MTIWWTAGRLSIFSAAHHSSLSGTVGRNISNAPRIDLVALDSNAARKPSRHLGHCSGLRLRVGLREHLRVERVPRLGADPVDLREPPSKSFSLTMWPQLNASSLPSLNQSEMTSAALLTAFCMS
jgi:hypothetical protein